MAKLYDKVTILHPFTIHQLKVQAETYDRGIIFSLLNSLDFEEFHLVLEHGITDDEVELLKRRTKADVRVGNPHPFPIREIITDAYDFFINHSFKFIVVSGLLLFLLILPGFF